MGKRAALLLTGALVEVDRLEGQEWGHQGSTGESNWEPLESACSGLLEHSLQTPGIIGVRNTWLKSTLYDLLLVVFSGGGFTLRDSLNTGQGCLFLPGERSARQKLLTTEVFLCRDHDVSRHLLGGVLQVVVQYVKLPWQHPQFFILVSEFGDHLLMKIH